MNRSSRIVILATAGLAGLAALAGATRRATAQTELAWELISEEDGVRVFRREDPDSPVLAVRGEAVLDVPVGRLAGLLMDHSLACDWTDMLVLTFVVRRISANEEIMYERYDLPWPLADRDFVFRARWETDADARVFHLTTMSVPDARMSPNECCVRAEVVISEWILTAIPDTNKTKVVMIGATDMKGSVPTWFVNQMQKSWPHDVIVAFGERARKPDVKPLPELENW